MRTPKATAMNVAAEANDFGSAMPEKEDPHVTIGIEPEKLAIGINATEFLQYVGTWVILLVDWSVFAPKHCKYEAFDCDAPQWSHASNTFMYTSLNSMTFLYFTKIDTILWRREDLITKIESDFNKYDRKRAEQEADKFMMDAENVNMYIKYAKDKEENPGKYERQALEDELSM